MVTDTEYTTAADPSADTSSAPTSAESPRGGAARRFSISGAVIAKTCEGLPDKEREALKWLSGYCTAKNISLKEIAPRILKPNGESYSYDSLYQALTGRREVGQLGPVAEAIAAFRRQVEESTVHLETEFIETAISRKIFAICDKARSRRKMVLIFGESQIGKTTNLITYQDRHNHGETIYVRLPTGASATQLELELAFILNVPTSLNGADRRRAIVNCFDSRMLLIVDEAHEGSVRALNFVREIHDRRKCGVVLSGTKVLREQLHAGPYARNFRQILLRCMPALQLPDRPSKAELAAFAAAYDLGPAGSDEIGARVTYTDDSGRERTKTITAAPAELQERVIARDGLGRWCMILQEARDMAQEKRRPVTWGSVIAAWHTFEQLSQYEEGSES